jgi:hypothetical protein
MEASCYIRVSATYLRPGILPVPLLNELWALGIVVRRKFALHIVAKTPCPPKTSHFEDKTATPVPTEKEQNYFHREVKNRLN